ncbi:MAG TPA: hypothetical protein VG838_13030 [Opitutaceae bacterium]|nr:hypothetical protein [Opitutaceae bacterium]
MPPRALLAFCALPLSAFAAPGISTSGSLVATWNDNLSHSSQPVDQREAEVFSASGAFSQRFPLSRDAALLAGGTAGIKACPRFDGLDDATAGAQLEVRQKFGLGPLAPVLSLQTEADAVAFRETARSGWTANARLDLAKRFDDAWRATVSAEWSRRDARAETFSREDRGLSAELTWDVTDLWQLSAGACRQWGGQEANASWNTWGFAVAGGAGPALANYYQRIPFTYSNTFGPGWVAYRIDGHTDLWWLSLAPALARNTALPLRYEVIRTHGEAGTHYLSHQVSLSLLHRF